MVSRHVPDADVHVFNGRARLYQPRMTMQALVAQLSSQSHAPITGYRPDRPVRNQSLPGHGRTLLRGRIGALSHRRAAMRVRH